MRVYLAGPIKGLTHGEATEWRDYATQKLLDMGHAVASPMRGKDYLKGLGPLSMKGDGGYPEFPLSTSHGLFRRDMFDTHMCDLILANLEGAMEHSIGTYMEIQRGYDFNKYVLTVLTPGSIADHAFVNQASSLVVPTLEDALHYLAVIGDPY